MTVLRLVLLSEEEIRIRTLENYPYAMADLYLKPLRFVYNCTGCGKFRSFRKGCPDCDDYEYYGY